MRGLNASQKLHLTKHYITLRYIHRDRASASQSQGPKYNSRKRCQLWNCSLAHTNIRHEYCLKEVKSRECFYIGCENLILNRRQIYTVYMFKHVTPNLKSKDSEKFRTMSACADCAG